MDGGGNGRRGIRDRENGKKKIATSRSLKPPSCAHDYPLIVKILVNRNPPRRFAIPLSFKLHPLFLHSDPSHMTVHGNRIHKCHLRRCPEIESIDAIKQTILRQETW